ncbi:hypothetical protein F5984_09760 [Rudanella paleaurantiibacter]|uniref:CopG family transcriptional regulator n=1 Tax=Rudanella paleaurantiibacter TaxID=2614655 RepID=A0A7J5U067_9BACT|nr:hypothetical protein [Rudanella paleaurantiibacter]KAB7731090.1 hypothetical protein F5984_09760 [Rudanella paleaurantiibacter]
MQPKAKRTPKTYRLTDETLSRINELTDLLGVDATAIIERSVEHYHPTGKAAGIEQMKAKLKKHADL